MKPVSDPATLEAMACAEALSLAEDLGIPKMEVTTDCVEVINMMKEKSL
jgi:ribonuclease HI